MYGSPIKSTLLGVYITSPKIDEVYELTDPLPRDAAIGGVV